jgi:hypothetical protein
MAGATVNVWSALGARGSTGRNVATELLAESVSVAATAPPFPSVNTTFCAVTVNGFSGSEKVTTTGAESGTFEASVAGDTETIRGGCALRRRSTVMRAPAFGIVLCADPVSLRCRSTALSKPSPVAAAAT